MDRERSKRPADKLESQRAKIPDVKRTPKKISLQKARPEEGVIAPPARVVGLPARVDATGNSSTPPIEPTSPVRDEEELITPTSPIEPASSPIRPQDEEELITPASPVKSLPISSAVNKGADEEVTNARIDSRSPHGSERFRDQSPDGLRLQDDDYWPNHDDLDGPEEDRNVASEEPEGSNGATAARQPEISILYDGWDFDMRQGPIAGTSEALLPTAKDMNDSFGSGDVWYEDAVIRAFIWKLCEDMHEGQDDIDFLGPQYQRTFYHSKVDQRCSAPTPGPLVREAKIVLIPLSITNDLTELSIQTQWKTTHWVSLELNMETKKATIWNSIPSFDYSAVVFAKKFLVPFSAFFDLGFDTDNFEIETWGMGDGWSCGIDVLSLFHSYVHDGNPTPGGFQEPHDFKFQHEAPLRLWISEVKQKMGLHQTDLDQEQHDIMNKITQGAGTLPSNRGTGWLPQDEDSDHGSAHSSVFDSGPESDDSDSDDPDNAPAPFGHGVPKVPVRPTPAQRQVWEETTSKSAYCMSGKVITRGVYAELTKDYRWVGQTLEKVFRRLSLFTDQVEELFSDAGADDGNIDDSLNACMTCTEYRALQQGKLPGAAEVGDRRANVPLLRKILVASGISDDDWEDMMIRRLKAYVVNSVAN